jgi:CRISPR-associated endonuclease/helicase Cas3
LLKDERIKSIGVIVNRVRVAASVAAKLESLGVEVRLITGRMRGEDRQSVLNEIDQRITSGVKVSSQNRPFVVVATQTIEVGADFDFDLIVTECASIDALIQRFGRADRLGNLDSRLPMRDRPSNVIIGSDRSIGSDDPVYRTAMGSTWSWLRDRDTDFGFTNLKAALPDGTEREQMSVPPVKYPILLSTHMARLIRTSRTPDADIDIAPFLHGFRLGEDADVEIVWRADLSEQLLHEADERGRGVAEPVVAEEVMDLIAAVPLSRGESLSVPISQARSWLRREGPSEAEVEADRELNDVEGSAMPGERPRGWMRPVIRWRGDDSIVTTNSGHLRPGDTVVVPAHYGGISNGTWDPLNTDTVPDVAFAAGLKAGRFRLRLSPALLVPKNRVKESGPTGEDLSQAEIHHLRRNELLLDVDADTDLAPDRIPTPTPTPGYVEAIEADPVTILRDWLEQAPSKFRFDEQVLACLHELWKELSIANIHVVASEWGPVYVLSDKVPTAANLNDEIDSEPGRSCNTGSMYELDRHLDDVKRWADRLSQACGLEPAYVSDLAKAGELHDLGKADPRFQSILREGQVAAGQPPLAKSAIPAQDRSRSARAGNQSGYPPGLRHELASVALLLEGGADPIPGAFDPVLVKYLIASHHGYSRPFAPVQLDRQSVQIKYDGKAGSLSVSSDHQLGVLGSELPEDFWDLVEHYGYFGLAWLETILRLADHGASREIDRTQTNPVRPSKGSQK